MVDISLLKIEPKFDIKLDWQKKRVGILNKGKNNTVIGNTIIGSAIGIQDEGENNLMWNNKVE